MIVNVAGLLFKVAVDAHARAAQLKNRSDNEDRRNAVLSAIVFSAIALEAFVNDLGVFQVS